MYINFQIGNFNFDKLIKFKIKKLILINFIINNIIDINILINYLFKY